MTRSAPSTARALFLRSADGGQRFAVHHLPADGRARAAVVFVHAFAEEMNKSRRMVSRAARLLAEGGCAVLQIDLLGCGDSSGDFADATWDRWLDDVGLAVDWLRVRHPDAAVILWGHRLGCLLAAEAAPKVGAAALLMWQPVASGRSVLQQLLRLKAAAGLQASNDAEAPADRVAPSSRTIKADWAAGRSVHVAGYEVSSTLAHDLERAALKPPATLAGVAWLEVSNREPPELLPASAATLQRWRDAGCAADARAVSGPLFWQTQEIEDAPALLRATTEAVETLVQRSGTGWSRANAHTSPRNVTQAAPTPERAMQFDCEGEVLVGVLAGNAPFRKPGVLIVVGGPQYRVGSHRQFVELARALAAAGHPSLRFDVRGMGDSTGEQPGFEQTAADIRAAARAFAQELPPGTPIVMWGLCDGASAALLSVNACADSRIAGLVLVNTWVRSESSLARTHVRHYYLHRLGQREFWAKLLRGGVGLKAAREMARNLIAARRGNAAGPEGVQGFQQRMAAEYAAFGGHVLLLQSGADLTAKEFDEFTANNAAWVNAWHKRPPTRVELAGADHTFSDPAHHMAAQRATIDWLAQLAGSPA